MTRSLRLIGVLLAVLTLCCACVGEQVRSERSEDGYFVGFDRLRGTVSEVFDLEVGDGIAISASISSGNAVISITAEGGEVIYSGRTPLPEGFRVNITSDGRYAFSVIGNGASGEVTFEIRHGQIN